FDERLAHLEVILRLEELQESALKFAVAQGAGDIDRLLREWIDAGIVHARGDVEWGRDEVLHLVGTVTVALEEDSQLDHGVQIAAGMAGDVVGNDVLFGLAGYLRRLL